MEEGGEAGDGECLVGGETDLCLMGERDLSLAGGLGDQEDTGTGDTGGLDLASGLPTMESMEKPHPRNICTSTHWHSRRPK